MEMIDLMSVSGALGEAMGRMYLGLESRSVGQGLLSVPESLGFIRT